MISCATHDYVEIACMYRFEVRLALENGQVVQGKALETAYDESKQECVVLETPSGHEMIVLEQVLSMEAVTENSHFGVVDFK